MTNVILECGSQEGVCGSMRLNMNVWVATWDMRNAGTGIEVFATRELAIDAAIEYAEEMELLSTSCMTVADARAQLLSAGDLIFEDAECYYGVVEHEVIGLP